MYSTPAFIRQAVPIHSSPGQQVLFYGLVIAHPSQRTLTMFVGVVALCYQHHTTINKYYSMSYAKSFQLIFLWFTNWNNAQKQLIRH